MTVLEGVCGCWSKIVRRFVSVGEGMAVLEDVCGC
jgi:hypothetical protein